MHTSTLSLLFALSSAALAARSTGCGNTPSIKPGHHGKLTLNSTKGGGKRDYILAIPTKYDVNKPAPLILSFHGNGKNATNQLYDSDFWRDDWNPDAVSVYPQGVGNKWTGAPYDTSGPSDPAFTADLLDTLARDLCIDTSRVYCSGKSLGGGFCNVLACDADLSARFAAIAPVSGAYYTTPRGTAFDKECHPARGAMPVLEFHGTADQTIPYKGGKHNGVDLRDIPDWAQQWADLNGCNGTKPKETKSENGVVTHYEWSCGSGKESVVQHYAIDGLGHKWPSKTWNPDNNGKGTVVDATPLIVEFFNKHSLPESSDASETKDKKQVASYGRRHARAFEN